MAKNMDNYPPVPPPIPQPAPVPPKKEEGIGKWALIAGGGCLAFLLFAGAIGFFIYYVFYLTGDPLKVVNQQLVAMREDNLEKAYEYCSSGFKNITNYQNFQSFVRGNPQLTNSKEFSSNNRSIENNVAKLKGNLISQDGGTTPAEYHLVKEDRVWKVQYIDLGATGITKERISPPATEKKSDSDGDGGVPGEPAREKGVLENIFGGSDLRFQNVNVEKSYQGNLTVITIRFKVVGFETDRSGGQPRIHLVQDLTTYGPNGNVLPELSKEAIKVLEDYGNFDFADLWNSLSFPDSYPRGKYECRLTVHDKISGKDTVTTAEFEL
jgi:hypothetical protein